MKSRSKLYFLAIALGSALIVTSCDYVFSEDASNLSEFKKHTYQDNFKKLTNARTRLLEEPMRSNEEMAILRAQSRSSKKELTDILALKADNIKYLGESFHFWNDVSFGDKPSPDTYLFVSRESRVALIKAYLYLDKILNHPEATHSLITDVRSKSSLSEIKNKLIENGVMNSELMQLHEEGVVWATYLLLKNLDFAGELDFDLLGQNNLSPSGLSTLRSIFLLRDLDVRSTPLQVLEANEMEYIRSGLELYRSKLVEYFDGRVGSDCSYLYLSDAKNLKVDSPKRISFGQNAYQEALSKNIIPSFGSTKSNFYFSAEEDISRSDFKIHSFSDVPQDYDVDFVITENLLSGSLYFSTLPADYPWYSEYSKNLSDHSRHNKYIEFPAVKNIENISRVYMAEILSRYNDVSGRIYFDANGSDFILGGDCFYPPALNLQHLSNCRSAFSGKIPSFEYDQLIYFKYASVILSESPNGMHANEVLDCLISFESGN